MRLNDTDQRMKLCIYIVFAATLFMIRHPMGYMSDDEFWVATVQDTSLLDNFIARWNFNGRIFTDVLANAFYRVPILIWKLFDVLVYLLMASMLVHIFTEGGWKNAAMVCGLLLLYPTVYLASAGYIATSTNYVYTVFGLLIVVYCLKRLKEGKTNFIIDCPVLVLAILYVTNHDQTAMVLLGGLFLCILYCLYTKADRKVLCRLMLLFLFSLCSYAFMFLLPGHRYRMNDTYEMQRWLPQYAQWSLIKRIYKGYSTTVANLFFSDLKIFHLFCLLLMLCGQTQKSRFDRTVAWFPCLVIVAGMLLGQDQFVIYHNYSCGMPDLISPDHNPIPLLLSLFAVAAIFYTVWMSVHSFERKAYIMILLILAAGSRLMMGLSATIYASSFRTFTVFIYATMISILLIMKELKQRENQQLYWIAIGAMGMALIS